jgi:type II secretory pathway pseudopilin PulG
MAPRRAATVRLISVALALIAIVAVIVPAALPKLNMARDYAEETSALKAIQTLNTAQVQYNSQFGRYALSLTELRPSASNLISADLAAGKKQGYKFKLTGTPTGYIITALPSALRSAGPRTFYSDQSLVIRENNSKVVASVAAKPRETK